VAESSCGSKLLPYIQSLTHQIWLFFLECQHQDWTVADHTHFPGYRAAAAVATADEKPPAAPAAANQYAGLLRQQQARLLAACEAVRSGIVALESADGGGRRRNTAAATVIPEHLVRQVTTVGTVFSHCVELILGSQIQRCVANILNGGIGDSAGEREETALASITALALEGNNLCRLLVGQGALPALLALCQDSRPAGVRIAALRALGSICCVLEGIQGFLALGGQERVVDILADRRRSEGERREAAGLLAQLTSPWIDGNVGFPGIELFLQEVVFSLKGNLGKKERKKDLLFSKTQHIHPFRIDYYSISVDLFSEKTYYLVFTTTSIFKIQIYNLGANVHLAHVTIPVNCIALLNYTPFFARLSTFHPSF
jgi:hypothetical protein